ncbi:MAG: response regulator [Povalibacter sp.]|jgi:DNA-binding response OmpR family regulator
MHELYGKRVLVVEDDYLIGAMVADMLESASAIVVGPARTRGDAFLLSRTEGLDAAVLDVNLRGEGSEVVAEELRRRHIPFLFATGYGEGPFREAGTPVLGKPFTEDSLLDMLDGLLRDAHLQS